MYRRASIAFVLTAIFYSTFIARATIAILARSVVVPPDCRMPRYRNNVCTLSTCHRCTFLQAFVERISLRHLSKILTLPRTIAEINGRREICVNAGML